MPAQQSESLLHQRQSSAFVVAEGPPKATVDESTSGKTRIRRWQKERKKEVPAVFGADDGDGDTFCCCKKQQKSEALGNQPV